VAKILSRSGDEVTVAVTVRLGGSLLEMEAAIQEAANALGCCATEEALKRFDADGSPIRVGAVKFTARGRDPKAYIRGATPLFASQVSHKYAQLNARAVQTDLAQNHGRQVAT